MLILLILKLNQVCFYDFIIYNIFFSTVYLFPDELFTNDQSHQVVADQNKTKDLRKIQIVPPQSQQQEQNKAAHGRITFNKNEEKVVDKKKSIMERLGKRRSSEQDSENGKKTKTNHTDGERLVSVVRKPEVASKTREVS